MKYRAKSEKAERKSWEKTADVVKDTLSSFLCTRNLQMYVGRATVRVQREAGVYTSGKHLAGGRVQTRSASAACRGAWPCRPAQREGLAVHSGVPVASLWWKLYLRRWVFLSISSVTWKS